MATPAPKATLALAHADDPPGDLVAVTEQRASPIRIYFDGAGPKLPGGGTKGVPVVGMIRSVVVVIDGQHASVFEVSPGLGTPYEAECEALLMSLRHAARLDAKTVEIIGDSLAVINIADGSAEVQANNAIGNTFSRRLERHKALMGDKAYSFRHVNRRINVAGLFLDYGFGNNHFLTALNALEGVTKVEHSGDLRTFDCDVI